MYLQEAKDLLLDVQNTTEEHGASVEVKFEILFHLSHVYYLLGMPKETIETFKQADAIKKKILDFLKDEKTQAQFLNRRLFRDFATFQKMVKL